jgi:hypothetical protein
VVEEPIPSVSASHEHHRSIRALIASSFGWCMTKTSTTYLNIKGKTKGSVYLTTPMAAAADASRTCGRA